MAEKPRLNFDSDIVRRMYSSEAFQDRFEEDPDGGITVIIPAAHVNLFWNANLLSIYREIPVAQLLVGDAGLDQDALATLRKFPRVSIFDHSGFTLGFSLRELILSVETEWFSYLHSDVFLPPDWFSSIDKHRASADWIGCRMIQTTIWVAENPYGERPYAGAQVGRTAAFVPEIEMIEDDYVWRQEDFVLAGIVESKGLKVLNADDAFHFHQLTHKTSEIWNPSLSFTVSSRLNDTESARVAETQLFGIVKYVSPATGWPQHQAVHYFLELILTHDFPAFRLLRRVRDLNPKWVPLILRRIPLVVPAVVLRKINNQRRQ